MKKANKGRVGLIIALAATMSCGSAIAISQLYSENGNGVVFASAETTSSVARSVTAEENSSPEVSVAAVNYVDWSYKSYDSSFDLIENVTVATNATSGGATYTGGAFVFKAVTDGIATAVESVSGRTVTSFTNVGTYVLSVKPQYASSYENSLFNFTIAPADIADKDITVKVDPVTYTGEEVTTSVKVFLAGVLLEEGKDYTVSYENNVNAGEGTVIITAKGNYTGTVEDTFTIAKAKLGVRWGLNKLTYNGGEQGIEVYPEGLAAGDEVTLTVKYYDETGSTEVVPQNVGKYVAKVTLENDNYELSRRYETYFYIVEKKVDVVWGNTEFVYYGEEHEITAHFVDNEGNEIALTVTADDLINAGDGTATAALPESGYENYVLTDNTSSIKYYIAKAKIEAEWDEDYDFKYDGEEVEIEVYLEGLNEEDLSEGVVYTYYDAEGNKLSTLPVDAGTYTVVISYEHDNYELVGKTEDCFTIAKADLEVILDEDFDGVYTGEGKTPLQSVEDEYGTELEYTVTYAPADESGNAIGEYSADLPVNVGKYILKVEVDAANVEQSEYTATFEITAKTVEVEWNFGDTAVEIDGVYTYLYNGKPHQPTATAEGLELTVAGTGKSVGNGYTTVASLNNPNYVLSGDLSVTFNVIKSEVESVLWYEYGATEPIADGVKPSYEYISVYGQEGAKLTAYGVLKPAEESVEWNAEGRELITLNVSYPRSSAGYWTELGTYTAEATLSSADRTNDACYMPLGINDEIEFEITAITHSASVANIKWVIEVNGKHVILTQGYKFTYTGEEITPMAIRVLSSAYDPDDLDEDTFEVLNVSAGRTAVGTYYAYIIPDPESTYEIKEADAELKFVIVPLEIEIEWEVDDDNLDEDENIVFKYNGKEQAPKAYYYDEEDEKVFLDVQGNVDAGAHFAIAETSANLVITNDNFIKYTITQQELSVEDIKWDFVAGDEGVKKTDIDGTEYFVWEYDGNEHKPTATLKVVLIEGEDPVEISLAITGSASAAGTHYAYVTLDNTDFVNVNYKLDIARLKFEIIRDSVEVLWEDADEEGAIVREYNGKSYSPKAYYLDGEGEKVELNVVGSGKDAGNYVACVTDDITASNSKTVIFTIKAKELNASWDKTTVNYNGNLRAPEVKFYNTVIDEEGNETQVQTSMRLGTDYTVTGYTNAGKYTSEITMLNGNYKVADGDNSHEFIINKKEVAVKWIGVDDSERKFDWNYDGEEHAPKATTTVEGLEITVKGAEKNVGTYTAVAVLKNDNYTITNPEKEFSVKGSVITVIWEFEDAETGVGEDGEEYRFWEYDGSEHSPKAYIKLDDGSKGSELDVVVDGGIYAGNYKAYAVLPADCTWANGNTNKCEFTIAKQIVDGIVWEFDGATEKTDEDGNAYYEITFNGKYQAPKAYIVGEDGEKGEELTVLGAQLNVNGKDAMYTATAVLANADNYEFAKDDEGDEGVAYEMRFVIIAKEVSVNWKGENGTVSDSFVWEYDGEVHCPTAWFTDVNGNEVEIPVVGGSASGGEHLAELKSVFANYKFPEAKQKKKYAISEIKVSVTWGTDNAEIVYDEEDETVITSITYTYTYNGKSQMPEAVAKTVVTDEETEGVTVLLNYLIKNEKGEAVGAIINAGTYTVTVSPADKNNKIGAGNVTEVKVIVKPVEVTVNWDGKNDSGEIEFVYNGKEQAPKAWFEDVNGQIIGLEVEGAKTEVNGEGETYTATAKLDSDNYVLKEDGAEVTFTIVPSTATEYRWVWNEEGVGSWVEVKDETGDGEDEGGETPLPDPNPNPNPNPNPDEGEEGEGGDNTGGGNENGGGTGDEGEGSEGEGGTTPSEPSTPNPDPAEGENPTTDPNKNKDENEGEGEDENPDAGND